MLSALATPCQIFGCILSCLPRCTQIFLEIKMEMSCYCQMMPAVAAVSFRVVKRSLLTTPPSKKKKTKPTRRLTTRRMRIFNCPQRQRLQRRLATDFRQIFSAFFYQRARSATNWSWHFNRLRGLPTIAGVVGALISANFRFQMAYQKWSRYELSIWSRRPWWHRRRCQLPVAVRPECDGLLPQRRKLLPLLDQWTQRQRVLHIRSKYLLNHTRCADSDNTVPSALLLLLLWLQLLLLL